MHRISEANNVLIPGVYAVRRAFTSLLKAQRFVEDKSGCKMLEIVGAHFVASENTIFSKVDDDYIQKEFSWYYSQDLNINSMIGKPPREWIKSADPEGFVNSNYGWTVYSEANFDQFSHVGMELLNHRDSRRAIMIYTRPNMWEDYNKNGRSDFMCTNTVQYLIRNDELMALVNMRSNDAIYGYKNDLAWQKNVMSMLCTFLNDAGAGVEVGKIIWTAGSLHVYERHFPLVEYFWKTGNAEPTKEELEQFK